MDKTEKQAKIVNIFHNPVTAWLILFCGICVTAAAWYVSNKAVQQRAEERFNHRVDELQQAIHDRMFIYEQALWGGVALFNSTHKIITREEFREYVDTLKINQHWPGIQGIGFSVPVLPTEKEAHIQSIRSEGFPEFTIKPEGSREEYSSIIYLEPFDWRNQRAFGYDMWSNDMRREAMTRARDTGIASTSGIITLVQETKDDTQKGFLTYLPVYKQGGALDSIEQRRAAFIGWVYSPFRMGDLMKGILGSEGGDIDYEIFDGEKFDEESLLFDSNQVLHIKESHHIPEFSKTVQLALQGREWTLHFESKPDYISGEEKRLPIIIASVGIAIDLLLFYVITALVFLQKRAKGIAEEMTSDLTSAKTRAEHAMDSLAEKVKDLELKNGELQRFSDMTIGREQQMIDLKKEINELCKELGEHTRYDLSFTEKNSNIETNA